MPDIGKAPTLSIYCAKLDQWFIPDSVELNQFMADVELPPNDTGEPIVYTFQLFVDDKPTGMFADVVVQAKQHANSRFFVIFKFDSGPGMSASRIRLLQFAFNLSGWKVDEFGRFYCDITDDFITERDHLDIWFDEDSLEVVMSCGFSSHCDITDGMIRFYTERVPSGFIFGRVMVLGEGGEVPEHPEECWHDIITREEIDDIFR